jgi:hypothetical protein
MGRPNKFHTRRHNWVNAWFGEAMTPARSHLIIELYPWHSIDAPQPFRPDPDAIRRFVWEPLTELGPIPIFAFGSAALFDVLPALPGVEVLARLPRRGEAAATYSFSARTREVLIGRAPTGGLLYIANHEGTDDPPPLSEIAIHQRLAETYIGS